MRRELRCLRSRRLRIIDDVKTAESEAAVRDFLAGLLSMKMMATAVRCWGYNFDWQSRNFFAPRDTPTIVPTAFAARALIEA